MGDSVNTNCLQECARSELIVRLTINRARLFHDCAYACVFPCRYVNIDLRATEYKIELFFIFVQLAFRKPPVRERF